MPTLPADHPKLRELAKLVAAGSSVAAAGRALAIPPATLRAWRHDPAFTALVRVLRADEQARLAEVAREAFDREGAGAALKAVRAAKREKRGASRAGSK